MPAEPSPNWERLRAIVTDALELPVEQRQALVRDRGGDDPPLVAEALALLDAYERSDGVIHPSTDRWLGLGGVDLLSLGGQRIGRYRLDRLISEGAMAAVYLATQANPQRSVALKLVRINLPLVDAAGRFMREADALGRVQHPNVARIYEAGVHRAGPGGDARSSLPFIAMEFVDGPPLTDYARGLRLSRQDRVRLLIKVADAVHAAHQRAIIHRDLKPANVLVDRSTGEPKVLDFGIARIAGFDDAQSLMWQTTAGVLLGTPGYMSPEQAAGKVEEIDVRSDIWSLGILLHELLTDRLPVQTAHLSITEALRRIESLEPAPIGRIDPSLRGGDLEVIVQTALAPEKQRRYASAQALADDLRRVLAYEPISARPPSAWYRAARFARRNRAGMGVALAFAALLIAAGVLVSAAYVRAGRDRDKAQAVNRFLKDIIGAVDPSTGDRNVAMLDALRAAEGRITPSLGTQPAVEADVRASIGWMYFGLGEYQRAHDQLHRSIELREQTGERHSPEAMQDRARLATTLRWLYRPKDALALADAYLPQARRVLGEDHDATLALRDAAAGAAQDTEDLDTAEGEYRAILERLARKHGDADARTLLAMNNLAGVLMKRGGYQPADALYRRALAGYERLGMGRTLNALSTRSNLAAIAAETGRLDESVADLRRLIDDCSTALGPTHYLTMAALGNLATHLERRGDADEAIRIQTDLLERHARLHGWAHPETLESAIACANMLIRQKRFDEAAALAARASTEAARMTPPDDLLYHRIRMTHAGALSGRREFAEAIAGYREALAYFRSTLGPDHRDSLITANNLALCLCDAGDGPGAVAVLEPALAAALASGFESMEPVMRRNLGTAMRLAGRIDESQSQLQRAYDLSVARGERANAAKSAEAMVELFTGLGDGEQAARWRALAVEAQRPPSE